MDLRICRICEKPFDIDSLPPNIRVVDTDDSHFTFIEKKGYGACHVLMTSAHSAERITPPDEVKYEVRPAPVVQVAPPQAPTNKEPHEPGPETITEIEAEQQVTFDELAEAQSSEPYIVEPEGDGPVEATVFKFDGNYGNGLARVEPEFRKPHQHVVRVDRQNVVTFGELRVGTRIRCVVGPTIQGFSTNEALEIEIFQEN
jgi:hypothetical protein